MIGFDVTYMGTTGHELSAIEEIAMPAPRLLPPADELVRMVRKGMTQQDIADETFRRTGNRVTRAAVSAALQRAGVAPQRNRYSDLLPWRVRVEHDGHYASRMLRAEGRLRAGQEIPAREAQRLENWKATLQANHVVVHYDPDTVDGFHYVKARRGVDTDLIRVPDEDRHKVLA